MMTVVIVLRISSVGFVSFPDRDLDQLEIAGALTFTLANKGP